MTLIDPSETVLIGAWKSENGKIVADGTARRIAELTQSYLQRLGVDASGWDTLYRDPGDGRFWELIYPHSELQGGGAPMLRNLVIDEAIAKYGEDAVKR